jgi:tetratricopeptide (TPR) repeat protein
MALGLMCKPILVTLPCALLLLDLWPLRRVRFPGGTPPETAVAAPFVPVSWRRALVEKIPLLALSAVMAFLTHYIHDALGMREDLYGLLWQHKLANAAVSYVRYLEHTVWPAQLAVLYLHPGAWPAWQAALCSAILLGISAVALGLARSRPFLLVGWLWFLGVLVPTIGLRQAGVQALADRFVYLPLIGLLVLIVWPAAEWLEGSGRRRGAAALAMAVVLAALTAVTWGQTATWRDSLTLWQRALAIDPRNQVAHANLGVEHLRRQDLAAARRHSAEAARLGPSFVEPRLNLALIAMREGHPEEARQFIEAAARLWPGAPAVVRATAEHWIREREFDLAILALGAYLKLAPEDLSARMQSAALLEGRGRPAEAVAEYREVLARQPDWAEAANNLAWLLATSPDAAVRSGPEAVRWAERACALTGGRTALFLGTLAAACAEAGRFDEAQRVAQQAIAQARAAGQANVVAANQRLLELYRAGQAHRGPVPQP